MNTIFKVSILSVLLFVVAVILRDSSFHFNTGIIENKRKHNSAQLHWNIGYDQNYVYYDSPLRYQSDLNSIANIIEPGYALFSDLATSYYAAATLPVYLRNTHRHHGVNRFIGMTKFVEGGGLCYLEDIFHLQTALNFLQQDAVLSRSNNWPILRYVLLNKDKQNKLLWKYCMPVRSRHIQVSLLKISELLYEGEYLNLYQLDIFSHYSLSPQGKATN